MPKRSRSRTRKRTRQSGGEGYEDGHEEGNQDGSESDKKNQGMGHHEEPSTDHSGGKRGKTSRKGKKRMKKSRKGKKMNEFFKLLIKAKKSGAPSFVYKGKTYKKKVGTKKNPKLVIYKKA